MFVRGAYVWIEAAGVSGVCGAFGGGIGDLPGGEVVCGDVPQAIRQERIASADRDLFTDTAFPDRMRDREGLPYLEAAEPECHAPAAAGARKQHPG